MPFTTKLTVTDYLSRYLIENYGFEDKRGQETYENWQTASDKYFKLVKPYLIESDYEYLKNSF